MKRFWKWLVPAVLALVMLLSVTGALAEGAYGMATTDQVVVRKQPSTDANYWFRIDTGFVCEILDVVQKGDTTWYKVNSTHPDPTKDNTYIGYVRGQYFRPLTEDETAAYLAGQGVITSTATPEPTATPDTWQGTGAVTATPTIRPSTDNVFGGQFDVGIMVGATATPTTVPTAEPDYNPGAEEDGAADEGTYVTNATGVITASGTNFRISPSTSGELIGKLSEDTVVELITIPDVVDSDHWYRIRYNGQEGYVQSNYVRVLTVGYTPTPAPSAYGYARLLYDSANLRDAAGGTTQAQWTGKGSMLQIVGPSEYKNSHDWYPVYYGVSGKIYYVRDDVVELVNVSGGNVTVVTPTPAVNDTVSGYGYVITTKGGVNLRLKPAGETVAQIKRGTVVSCIGNPVKPEGSSYTWYYVQYNNLRGYLRGDCVKVCNANGDDIVVTTAPTATPAPVVSASSYVKLIKGNVNLREEPAGSSQGYLPKDLILPVVGNVIPKGTAGKYAWYPVRTADGRFGYVRSDCVMECDANGNEITATATPAPGTTVTPGVTGAPVLSTYGYVQITQSSTNLRDSVDGDTIYQLKRESVWPLIGLPVTYKQVTWYPIQANGYTGFVRGDCAYKLSAEQELSYLQGNGIPEITVTPEPTPVMSNYVKTILDYVNLRKSASKDAAAPYKVRTGTVMAYTGTKTVGTATWYRIVYKDTELWVLGSCVEVMTQAEYDAWLGENPAATPQPDAIKGYLKTVKEGVNVRDKANGSKIVARLTGGSVVPYYAEAVAAGNYDWYAIRTLDGVDGYVRSDMVEKCDQNGGALPTATPVVGGNTGNTGSTSPQEATYTTLRLGSSGTKVKNLVTELKNQGYYAGSITSNYTSAVREAVIAFQTAKGLTVDGIAGSQTQHALYGTVPPGTADYTNLTFDFYPAEKIDWFTGGIQQLWAKGANYKVYDVKTGIVWWAHRWSGADHADVEPLTAADTARLCQIYGVDDAQDIWDNNLWQRRPCLVTIGTRTFACSLMGMPHNPDGDTIDNNNMTGQICIHFTNSKGHESGKVDSYHQKAIEEAYQACPAGQK
ncbi:MAG: SH3 domain-containing protein [Clostridia bacterium]|nr:SH3 domain-containing protein [Clostridia bacterium]